MTDPLIREYDRCFNERRLADPGALFAAGALVDRRPFAQGATGAAASAQVAEAWLRAFPDAQFTIKHVEPRGDTMSDVDLVATGTQTGSLDLGTYGVLKPSGGRLTVRRRGTVGNPRRVHHVCRSRVRYHLARSGPQSNQ